MLLTFVLPSYNRAALLPRAIDSVLQQRERFSRPFQIIVVDDGSTDDTAGVLARYVGDPAVEVIDQRTNRGLGHARNAAFGRARGEWCVLLDSDNALLPDVADRLESQLLALAPAVGVFWGGSVDDRGRPTVTHGVTGRLAGRAVLARRLGGEHFSAVRTALARAHAYPSLGTRHACEPAFWARVALACDFFLSSERFQYYETAGEDRFCAVESRVRRAAEMATCYDHTAAIVLESDPRYHWELRGKAAFYRSVAGDWVGGARAALGLLGGLPHHWRNSLVLSSCLAGPSVSRWLLRRSAAES